MYNEYVSGLKHGIWEGEKEISLDIIFASR